MLRLASTCVAVALVSYACSSKSTGGDEDEDGSAGGTPGGGEAGAPSGTGGAPTDGGAPSGDAGEGGDVGSGGSSSSGRGGGSSFPFGGSNAGGSSSTGGTSGAGSGGTGSDAGGEGGGGGGTVLTGPCTGAEPLSCADDQTVNFCDGGEWTQVNCAESFALYGILSTGCDGGCVLDSLLDADCELATAVYCSCPPQCGEAEFLDLYALCYTEPQYADIYACFGDQAPPDERTPLDCDAVNACVPQTPDGE